MQAMAGEMLTTKQVAEMLNVSEATVKRLLTDGKMPGYRISDGLWRVDSEELKEYLHGRRNIQDK